MSTRKQGADDRGSWSWLGGVISALDDRNLQPALRLLEPARKDGDVAVDQDRAQAQRCIRCATRGE